MTAKYVDAGFLSVDQELNDALAFYEDLLLGAKVDDDDGSRDTPLNSLSPWHLPATRTA